MLAGIQEYFALALVYSLLAGAILETLPRLWMVRDPRLLFHFRLGIMAIPPVATLLFAPFGAQRASAPFRQQIALLNLQNWLGPEPSLSHVGWVTLIAVMAITTLLLIGLGLAALFRGPGARAFLPAASRQLPNSLQTALCARSERVKPGVDVLALDDPEPIAFTSGFRRQTVLLSVGLCDILDQEELQAVLAHEIAHARRRDNRLSWLLFGLRLLSFYSPVALLVSHQMGHDVERLCDADAASSTGNPLALASALIKVYRASRKRAAPRGQPARFAWSALALEQRAKRTLVEDRVERLVHPERLEPVRWPTWRLALASAAVLALTYFVV